MKYIRNFEDKQSATGAQDLVAPHVSYCEETNQTLYCNGTTDTPVEIIEESGILKAQIKVTGPEYVDLGLPSGKLWMKYNLGVDPNQLATVADYCGKYYQFGDVVGYTGDDAKAHSTWSTCPCNGGADDYDETYFNAHKSELLDSNNKLFPACDAVTVAYSDWHMPTKDDYVELISTFCTWSEDDECYVYKEGWSEWATDYNNISGLNGILLHGQGEYAGNDLFIPAAGGYYDGEFYALGVGGYVWSSVLNSDDPDYSFSLLFYSDYVLPEFSGDRYVAFSVRGVK